MNKRYFLVLVVCFGLGVAWWLFTHQSSKTSPPAVQQPLATNTGVQTAQKQQTSSQPAFTSKPATPDAVREFVLKTMADHQYEWKQPINFYGRVVDESNEPLANASVHFEWNDISVKGTSDADTVSDGNGFFSLTDRRGKRLYVDVGKEGYYSSGNSRGAAFEYANPADGLFTPDQNNPVVFHLRKKGAGVDLIISQNGMSTQLRISPPTNGSAVFLDFYNQKIGDVGQLKIEGWKEPKDFTTGENNWGLRLTVPDGGLTGNSDEFSFEAPDTGYESVLEWHFTNGQPDWCGFLKTNFYVQFGNPPRYGKITVETLAFSKAVFLDFAINPDGSRNLEPKR